MSFFSKFKGNGAQLPPKPSLKTVAIACVGGVLAILILAGLNGYVNSNGLILASFGASCMLIFGYPDAPFSQPRNVVIGHFISSLTGLIFLQMCGPQWWSVAFAVGISIALMMLSRTVHPPAASNSVVVFLTQPAWSFLLFPTLIGALIIVAFALVYNNLSRKEKYPQYW